jgi:hypothetical protein
MTAHHNHAARKVVNEDAAVDNWEKEDRIGDFA